MKQRGQMVEEPAGNRHCGNVGAEKLKVGLARYQDVETRLGKSSTEGIRHWSCETSFGFVNHSHPLRLSILIFIVAVNPHSLGLIPPFMHLLAHPLSNHSMSSGGVCHRFEV